jgi:hypothetical protein
LRKRRPSTYRCPASNPDEWDRLSAVLEGFEREPFDAAAIDRADQVQRLLAGLA